VTPPPLHDVRGQWALLRQDIEAAIARVLASGQYIQGAEGERFERAYAFFVGARFGVGTASGTDALRIALQAVGVGPNDAVVTVANAGVPPVAAIEAAGATPVFVDVEPDTGNLDCALLDQVSLPAVRAVLVVHLYGHPADMGKLLSATRARNWKIVEDCSHAHGGRYLGQRVGALGDAAAFSFYPTKNLGAVGDAGIVTTNDESVAERARLFRNHGWGRERLSDLSTCHSRLDEIQAAVLSAKLPHLDAWNARRRELAARYAAALAGVVELPAEHPWAECANHLYVIRTPRRDEVRRHLESLGIGTGVHYALPVYKHPAYRRHSPPTGCPVTERWTEEVLSLPMFPGLEPAQLELVTSAIIDFFHERRAIQAA
jgi:dTDP-4-amino-4,6-dideoxygalactose transaminase